MTSIRISSSETDLIITLVGDWSTAPSSKIMLEMYLGSLSGTEYHGEDNKYVILVKEGVEEAVVQFFQALKEDNQDFEVEYDDAISKNLQNYRQRQEDFAVFSEAARRIRDNVDHDFSKLAGFEDSLLNLARKLKWHQKLSSYHLAFAHNACNFSVPGAGKTTVVYAAYNYLRSNDEIEKLVVVGPLSSAIAWENEYVEVFGCKPKFLQINGTTKKNELNSIYKVDGPEIIHLTYQSLNNYVESLRYLCSEHKVMMVLDEAHRIKNPDGFWIKALDELVTEGSSSPVSRIVLSGTPAPNGYKDIYNLYKFIWPQNKVIGFTPKQLDIMSKSPERPANKLAITQLVKDISPYYVRVKKSDLNLPGFTLEPIIIAPMDVDQKRIHDFFKDKFMTLRRSENVGAALGARLIRLRQAASNPALLLNKLSHENLILDESLDVVTDDIRNLVSSYVAKRQPIKFSQLKRLVSELNESGRRVIIWCEFITTMNMLKIMFEEANMGVELLNGATGQEDRKRIINDFNQPNCPFSIIIANPQAVGESISLHHQCHDAIYFEMSYNAGNYMQSKDRIHRLGLPEGVTTKYHFVFSDAPVEQQILKRVIKKEEMMIQLIDSEEIPLIAVNKELFEETDYDLRSLYKAYEQLG